MERRLANGQLIFDITSLSSPDVLYLDVPIRCPVEFDKAQENTTPIKITYNNADRSFITAVKTTPQFLGVITFSQKDTTAPDLVIDKLQCPQTVYFDRQYSASVLKTVPEFLNNLKNDTSDVHFIRTNLLTFRSLIDPN